MITRRYILSLSLVCALLLGVFSNSLTAHASSVSGGDYSIMPLNIEDEDLGNSSMEIAMWNLINSNRRTLIEYTTFNNGFDGHGTYQNNTSYLYDSLVSTDRISLKFKNNEKMFSKGDTLNINLSNYFNYINVEDVGTYHWNGNVRAMYIYFIGYNDINNKVELSKYRYNINDHGIYKDIEINGVEVPADTYCLQINIEHYFSEYTGASYLYGNNYTYTRNGGFNNLNVNVDIADTTKGLLGSIIEWLENIRDNIVNLPSKIASSIKGFFDNVVNAVSALGDKLLDGIKGLFVPDADSLAAEKDKWDNLLEDRFGALYQVVALIDDYASTFQASEKKTITLPEVTVPLGDAEFVFGGWEVPIVPDGFDVLMTAVKLIISIACTVLFVNGLRNRFERVVDGT